MEGEGESRESAIFIAVDLGGTRFRVAAVDAEGRVLRRVAEQTRVHEGRETVLRRIYGAVHQIIGLAGSRPLAIAVGAPGPIDPEHGVIYSPPNMPDWDKVPLRSIVEQEFGVPVFVGNDANIAALGEHRFGAGVGTSDMVYITVSTGIGGGIIAGGRLLLGAKGLAGEIGHMTIVPDGPRCGCGNRGCLEALSSGTAIGRRGRELAGGEAGSGVLALAGGDPTAIDSLLVEEAARRGDELARRIMREAAEHLGIGVANIVHVLNPQMVVIGGGVSNAGDLLFGPVREVVDRRTMPAMHADLQIVPAKLGDDAGLSGCAALVMAATDRRPGR